ncbi:MAG: M48 family metalloprotease [Candidatus Diapherotrites archaeon]|nr:M48 family metalloprotease [Candidatus Diapherotrites archaeon]
MASELACVNSCVIAQGAPIAYLNYFLIALIAASAIALMFFQRKLSMKISLLLKAVLLTGIFSLLITLLLASGNHDAGIFNAVHTSALFLTLIFFATSYLFTPFIAQIGLKRHQDSRIEEMLAECSARIGIRTPGLYIFEDATRMAFVVSALKKTVFISTGMIQNFNEEELRIVLMHELLHIKSGFFNAKRFLHSIRAGFFGLLPVHLEELDTIEEMRLDNQLMKEGLDIQPIRQKL